jgi:acetylornithine deacetylase
MAHKGVFNSSLKRSAITAATDSRFFGIYQKTPALVYGPVGERIHAFDEYVSLDSLKNITKVYAKFIQNWCGLSKL